MIWADYVIIAIVVFSAIVGMVRGFTREAFSLASWIGAFIVAGIFVGRTSQAIAPWVPGEQLRLVLAFVGLFAVTLLVGIVVNHFVSSMVERANLGRADRSFGLFFGIVRGYVAVAALVALASFTSLPQKPWWQQSMMIPYTLPVASWIVNHLPRSELEKVKRIKGSTVQFKSRHSGRRVATIRNLVGDRQTRSFRPSPRSDKIPGSPCGSPGRTVLHKSGPFEGE